MKTIQLICFDLDDTLWPCVPTIIKAEEALYQWLKDNKPDITRRYGISDLRDKRIQLAKKNPHIKHNLTELRKVSFRELASEFNDPTDWFDIAFNVFYEARQKIQFYDDVEEVLTQLSQRFTIASMTNGNADIYTTSLGSLFDYSISAEQVGVAKPDSRMFKALIDQSGIAAKNILYIGDHPVHDIEGAQRMGIPNVWLNREGVDWSHDSLTPAYTVNNLHEILSLLSMNDFNSTAPKS